MLCETTLSANGRTCATWLADFLSVLRSADGETLLNYLKDKLQVRDALG